MTCRGVKKQGSKTVTFVTKGDFPKDKRAQALAIIR